MINVASFQLSYFDVGMHAFVLWLRYTLENEFSPFRYTWHCFPVSIYCESLGWGHCWVPPVQRTDLICSSTVGETANIFLHLHLGSGGLNYMKTGKCYFRGRWKTVNINLNVIVFISWISSKSVFSGSSNRPPLVLFSDLFYLLSSVCPCCW